MAGYLGISIYGLLVVVVTVVALFTRGWTRATIIFLVVAWVPLLLFLVAAVLLTWSLQGGILHNLLVALTSASPILLIIGVFLAIWKFAQRFRD